MSSLIILYLNATFISLITFFYYIRSRGINIGFILLFFYSMCTWGSVLFYQHPMFVSSVSNSNLTLEPFIYLQLVLLVFFYPILKFKTNKVVKIEFIDESFLFKIIYIFLIIQAILYIIYLPYVFKSLFSSNIGDFRDSLYEEAAVVNFPNYALNLLSRLYFGARNVVIIIAVYALLFVRIKRPLVIFFFISSFLFPIYAFIAYASRAVMVLQMVFVVYLFVAFWVFVSHKFKKKIIFSLLAFLLPIVYFFIFISNSRFGNMATYMFYRYWGESFINYNGLLYNSIEKPSWGTSYFTFFQKLFGVDIPFKTTVEKWNYIENITGIDPHIFYTFIGGLNIEFGFGYTFLLGLCVSYICVKALRPLDTLTLPKLILIGMLGYLFINGAFMFVLQGDWGNLEIIFTVFFYFLLKKHRSSNYILKNENRYFNIC